jgi:hypothetical protein
MPFINPKLLITDPLDSARVNPIYSAKWLLGKRDAFLRGKILEIPDSSSLDCSLLGLPNPDSLSEKSKIERAVSILKQQFDESGNLFCLNLHDWIIGTSNRLEILEEVILYIKKTTVTSDFVTAKDFTKAYFTK